MSSSQKCSKCGAALPAESVNLLCPSCMDNSVLTGGLLAAPGPASQTLRMSHEPLASDLRILGFGDYQLLEEIDRGGMGVVYRARQISLNRVVALKMILAGQFARSDEVRRFLMEAEAAANLAHPNIVPIYEIGQHEGQHYFSMRLIEGRSLDKLGEQGGWEHDEGQGAARLISKVARAVQYAHEHGILHRDLKPGNILIDPNGEPYVTDFGLARQMAKDSSLTLSGAVLGTPSFMAPEQAAGKIREMTASADIYSLGAILYFLLTGRPPFAAESILDTLAQVLGGEVVLPRTVNPRVARELEQICLRCLEKSPELRYESAGALADDLERFLRNEPIELRTDGVQERLRLWIRREPALASHLIALFTCAAISEETYQLTHHMSASRHLGILAVLTIWALVSVACQQVLKRPRWAALTCGIWAGLDAVLLTVVIYLAQGLNSPLIALYLAAISLSGLWFRGAVVGSTTILSMLGYSVLLWAGAGHPGWQVQASWHLLFFVAMAITGLVITYLVHRVQTLSRFYGQRPKI